MKTKIQINTLWILFFFQQQKRICRSIVNIYVSSQSRFLVVVVYVSLWVRGSQPVNNIHKKRGNRPEPGGHTKERCARKAMKHARTQNIIYNISNTIVIIFHTNARSYRERIIYKRGYRTPAQRRRGVK